MKKHYLVASILAVFFLFQSPALEARPSKGDEMAYRAGRGLKNIILAPTDVLNTYEDVRFKEGYLQALTYGVLKGVFTAIGRTGQGVYELLTFYDSGKNKRQFSPAYDSAIIRLEQH